MQLSYGTSEPTAMTKAKDICKDILIAIAMVLLSPVLLIVMLFSLCLGDIPGEDYDYYDWR